jgi:CPA2 family monovalent cation:H+ antiporter-2
VVPMLSGDFQFDTLSVTTFFLKIAILLIFLFLLNRWIVPHILYQVTRTRSRELFLMTVAFLAFATAWLTSLVGLSLALGAFLAGLIVSESEYSSEAFANILPLRDIFLSFFFVSIGMLLDIRIILNNPLLILISFIAILLIKMISAGFASLILGYSLRKILIVMFTLAQIGEFSFILFKVGMNYQLMPDTNYQNFLAVSILTMMFTPFIFNLGRYADQISRFIPFSDRLKLKEDKSKADLSGESVSDHLIIIGYGLNGQNLTRAAQALTIPYQVIDLNPDTVRREKKSGTKIFYGDATQKSVLKHANIDTARVLVIAINDAAATRRITQLVREMNPAIYLITRTRYVQEVKALFDLGANEVIPEEYETSIEIFTRVLTRYLVPEKDIHELVEKIRAEGYQALRISPPKGLVYLKTKIPQAEICTLEIPENSSIQGRTLKDIQIREKYNVNLLAIQRQNK